MEKIEVGTKVKIDLNSQDAAKLGISGNVFGSGTVAGHYPKGHYIAILGKKTPLAIADKYNAITQA